MEEIGYLFQLHQCPRQLDTIYSFRRFFKQGQLLGFEIFFKGIQEISTVKSNINFPLVGYSVVNIMNSYTPVSFDIDELCHFFGKISYFGHRLH